MPDSLWPTGNDYVNWWLSTRRPLSEDIAPILKSKKADFDLFGRSLSTLHQIAMCYPECRGGPHIYEALVGRIYNHSVGSFSLICLGFYDESLNLVRGIGEASNLLLLFLDAPENFEFWCAANPETQWKKYKPSEVRKKLQALGSPMPMDASVYSELCKIATHITPSTRPNFHSTEINTTGYIGGLYQEKGLNKTLDHLIEISAAAAMIAARGFGREVLLHELTNSIKSLTDAS